MSNYKTYLGKNKNIMVRQRALTLATKAWFIKENVDKLNFLKIIFFSSVKDPVKGMNRQDTDQDKILEHNIYIEELVFRRCKAFSKVKVKI